MPFFAFAFIALLGFVLGYFFALPILIVVTAVWVAINAYLFWDLRNGELAGLIPWIVAIYGGVGAVVMWVTYYQVSGQTFVGDFIRAFVIR